LLVQHPISEPVESKSANWLKARALLKALVLSQPKNPRYLGFLAKYSIEQKEYADAELMIAKLDALERERKTAPGGFGSIELRAKLLEQRGLGAQAVAVLTAYAELPGAAPARKLLLAELHGRLGNYREAIDLCEEVRKTGANFHEANITAVGILGANKPSEAQPTRFQRWQTERDRVETSLRSALQKDPKDIPLRLHLASMMELQGNYAEVETLCRDVLKDNGNHLVALGNLAWHLGQKPATAKEALRLIEHAIALYGPRPELLDTQAIVHLNLGNTKESLRVLERVVNEAPTPIRVFHLCRAYERTRNVASAQAMLRQSHVQGLAPHQLHPAEQAEYQRVSAELGKRQ